MRKIHYILTVLLGFLTLLLLFTNFYFNVQSYDSTPIDNNIVTVTKNVSTSIPTPISASIPERHVIPFKKHMFQTFNNCGPASLSMQLSYYGIDVDQQTLGSYLRPHQNPQGINDDKTVSLNELAKYAEDNYGLIAYQKPGGDIEMLKEFISNDIPVVVRTWLEVGEDIGHYRLVRGYDDEKEIIIQDDSYQNKDLEISYQEFEQMWMPFSWEFLVLANQDQKELVETILGSRVNVFDAWRLSLERSSSGVHHYENIFAVFNQSRSQYYLNNYQESIELYESVSQELPFRMLWYQYEPIMSYLQTGNYDRVFELTSSILNNNNLAFSELYLIRGEAYQAQGNIELARQEYEKAAFYNKNLEDPKRLLTQFGEN